jgi:hypothetical protein
MFRFYKGAEKIGRWKAISTENESSKIILESTHFATVLAVDQKPKKGESIGSDAKYTGPFYIDIDSDDISKSIKALKRTLAILRSNGLTEKQIYIWASGKRGFHLLVPMRVFTHEVPTRRLPFIYKQLMIMLSLPDEVDRTVYSSGKGRMWRVENKKRIDAGTYKVKISFEEALNLTEDLLADLIQSPREDSLVIPIGTCSAMSTMFGHASKKAEAVELKESSVFIDPTLKKALGGEFPPCVSNMLKYDVDEEAGFNAVSLQVGKGIASFAPQKADEVIGKFCEVAKGQSYNTYDKKHAHASQAFKQALKNHAYGWACASALSVLENDSCCETCPISFIRYQDEKEETEDADPETEDYLEPGQGTPVEPSTLPTSQKEAVKPLVVESELVDRFADPNLAFCLRNLKVNRSAEFPREFQGTLEYNDQGLMESDSGYSFMTGNGTMRTISNFTIRPLKSFVEYVPNLSRDVRTGSMVAVYTDGTYSGNSFLEDRCWNSKAGFIGAFTGLGNASFYGKDDDVQRMKAAIMTTGNTGAIVRKVYSAGIHRDKVGGNFVFTYVEPDWSIDQYGNQDTYQLSGKVNAVSPLKDARNLEMSDIEVSDVLRNILRSNLPCNVAQVLGWTMACFLKQHIFAFRNEFPIISLHGEPGSGKTSTIGLFAAFHGCDYRLESSPVNLPTATSFVVWKFISGTTTMPRLIEEFNKSKMPRTYEIYAENFKACWNQHSVQRGGLDQKGGHGASLGGAYVQEIPLTGPVALCSEQQILMPALVERTVQIRYSQAMRRDYSVGFTNAAEKISAGALLPFAKMAYMEAVCMSVDEVKDFVYAAEKHVSTEMSTRPRYSFQVILAGLSFFEKLIDKWELTCASEFAEIKKEFVTWLTVNSRQIASSKKVSEVDLILSKLNTMAAISNQEGAIPYLLSGSHYMVAGEYLNIDVLTCHAQYIRYASSIDRETPVITNIKEFRELLSGEDYCLSVSETMGEFADGRPIAVLRLEDLAMKGIDFSGFKSRR